jgi:RNA polymerase sigma-70 factor, ECF subfamily
VTTDPELRRAAFATAYKITGSVASADDIAQDSLVRWYQAEKQDVRSPAAYVACIAANLSIDLIRREQRTLGTTRQTLPEPAMDHPALQDEPADLSYALLAALSALTPLERAVFLLRNGFDCPFADIGVTLGRSAAACRQAHARAARVLRDGRRAASGKGESAEADALLRRLVGAVEGGDLAALREILAADVVVRADGGAKGPALKRPLVGADAAAKFLVASQALLPEGAAWNLRRVGRELALVVRAGGTPVLAVFIAERDSRIGAVFAIADREKIRRL